MPYPLQCIRYPQWLLYREADSFKLPLPLQFPTFSCPPDSLLDSSSGASNRETQTKLIIFLHTCLLAPF